jgi:hypothetical protein
MSKAACGCCEASEVSHLQRLAAVGGVPDKVAARLSAFYVYALDWGPRCNLHWAAGDEPLMPRASPQAG